MRELHMDLESRSRVNLPRAGAYEYWEDESTDVLCMAWRFGEGDIEAWVPGEGPFPGEVNRHIREGGLIWAHNAAFERLAFWNVLAPDHGAARPILEQFRCSAAVARTNALPGALADVPRALELPHQKNPRGQELIRLLCVPQGVTAKDQRTFWPEGDFREDSALLEEMIEYCMDDVAAESGFLPYLRELSAGEWEEYHAQERINDRGMAVDRELCRLALPYAEVETAQLNARNHALTGIAKIRSSAMAEWVRGLLPGDLMVLMTREDGKLSLAKDIVTDLLATNTLPGTVREVLELRQQVSKSSVAKFRTMLNHSELTGRVRGAYLFSGAPSTGRVAARGLNLQNFTRDCMEDPEAVLRTMREQAPMEDVMSVLSRMLRPALIAEEGNVLLWGDLASIEARVMPWLTDSQGGDAVLDIFRECDVNPDLPDIYERTAEGFGGTRQEGKTLSLACIEENVIITTDKGPVPIREVTTGHRVWDGVKFVWHLGTMDKGVKEVITYDGLTATPDHIVFTDAGELRHIDAARSGARLLQSRPGRQDLRVGESTHSGAPVQAKELAGADGQGAVHQLRPDFLGQLEQPDSRVDKRLSPVLAPGSVSTMAGVSSNRHETTLLQSARHQLEELWRARYRVSIWLCTRRRGLDFAKPGAAPGADAGSYRQQRTLRAGEFTLLHKQRADAEHAEITRLGGALGSPRVAIRKVYGNEKTKRGLVKKGDPGTSGGGSLTEKEKLAWNCRKARVYDILNAGPRNRFAANDRLVHNCQYQGGLGAFHAMARIYGVSATDRVAEHLIKRWRRDNAWAVRFWRDLQTAAEDALRYPERWHDVGRVALSFTPDIMAGTLWLLLPSGRRLAYPRIEVEYVEGRYGLHKEITAIKGALKPKVGEPWPRQHLYAGRFAAAATQGTAADLLRSMMVKMGQVGGVNVVGSTHDELICEVGDSELGVATRRLSRGMQEGPAWAEGLPLVAEIKEGKRYYK